MFGIDADTSLAQPFTTVVDLAEHIRQDDDNLGAKELHTLLQSIRQHGMAEAFFWLAEFKSN